MAVAIVAQEAVQEGKGQQAATAATSSCFLRARDLVESDCRFVLVATIPLLL